MHPRELLRGAYLAGVAAVSAAALLPPWTPAPGRGRDIVVAAGKAAAAMAAVLEAHWPEDAPLEGLAITRHGHGAHTRRLEVVEAGHPLPDAAGLAAAERLLRLVQGAGPDDQVIALLSGGGSSLLTCSAGVPLADLRAVANALLASGAPIADINCVRKHLSRTLGGRLAQACRGRTTVLMISDVTGDDPAVIASGPFSPDPTTLADARAVLRRWKVTPPRSVQQALEHGEETPKPGDPCFQRVTSRVLGNGRTMLEAAAMFLGERGVTPVILGDAYTGEAREVAKVFAALAREIQAHDNPWKKPVVLLSGGETSVTVRGRGRGGRNTEFLLALALEAVPGLHALAADSDGVDGTESNAGAYLAPDAASRAAALGLDLKARLDDNDAWPVFDALGDLLITGPTRTNANDFRALLVV